MQRIRFVLLALALAAAGCPGRGNLASYRQLQETTRTDERSLGVGDVFQVTIYDEANLSGLFQVGQDGSVNYPLVGVLQVGGLDPSRVGELIATALEERQILRRPQVSIFVKEYNSKRISVSGAVSRAGTFPYVSGLTLQQVITLAGGFSALASRNATVVTRQVAGEMRRYDIPAGDIEEGQLEDVLLNPGDKIFVPQRVF